MQIKLKNIVPFLVVVFFAGILFLMLQSRDRFHSIFKDFDFKASQYVDLYEYRDIKIDDEMLIITEQDIEAIVNMDFSSNEIYKEIHGRTIVYDGDIIALELTPIKGNHQKTELYYVVGSEDFSKEFDIAVTGAHISEEKEVSINNSSYNALITGIYEPASYSDEEIVLTFYGFSNMDKVKEHIIQKACKSIIYNYKTDKILNSSTIIAYPSVIEYYVSTEMKNLHLEAQKENVNVENYVQMTYGMSIEETEQQFYNYYFELMIIKAVLEKENIPILEKEFNHKIKEFSKENDIPAKEVLEEYGVEVYYCYLTEDLLKPYLTK